MIDLYTALELTKSLDNKEIYVKYPDTQFDKDCEIVLMDWIKQNWDMKSVKVSEISIYWNDYDSTVFLFTIIKPDN